MEDKVIHIFLDIDGVVATMKSFNQKWKEITGFDVDDDGFDRSKESNHRFPPLSMNYWPFDSDCCSAIHELQLKYRRLGYDVRYVISSSWRTGRTIEEMDKLFILKGLVIDTMVGKTPRLDKRGQEINQWLKENDALNVPFIVIDDECDFDIKQYIDEKHLINTKGYYGFDKLKQKEAYDKIDSQINKK